MLNKKEQGAGTPLELQVLLDRNEPEKAYAKK